MVSALETDPEKGTTLTISLPPSSALLSDAHVGDSISTNGVCLTVTSLLPADPSAADPAAAGPSFTVGVAPETLRVTNLGGLAPARRVNLERAVRADTRMGGHFVQGHVDTTARIVARRPDGEALTLRFEPRERAWLRYIVHKGFVAVDGTSLTVTRVEDREGWWEVMLIAYTQDKVVVSGKEVGETVNVEVDMMAKYAEKSMAAYLAGGDGDVALLEKLVGKLVDEKMGKK